MKKAKVAIITRTKDRPIMLERAINSVCSQTFQDWIMVIVNDGGDQTEVNRLVEKYKGVLKDRVEVIHHEKSLGMEAASNRGIMASDSDYILIHDDDDSLNEYFLDKTVKFLESSMGEYFGGVATKVVRVVEEIEGNRIIIKSRDSWQKELNSITIADMAVSNKLVPISVLYRRKVHNVIGYYNENLPVLGDWEFYLRFLTKFDIFY
ncbi:glycosyltransferase [Geobacillus stearothermophilus]|nr:glycosyltransferase [Geobacillus stearothermophilus]